jgi:hypothetical protein
MTNQQKREKKESKGFKITSNIGYRNGEQTIVSYTLKDKYGKILSTEKTLSKLLK